MVVNCEHVWQEISNFLEGDIRPELRVAIEAHVKECRKCTAVLDGTRNVLQLYGDDRLLEVPVGFSRRLQRRLEQEASSSRYPGVRSLWMWAVAAALLIAGGLSVGNSTVFRRPVVRSKLAQPAGSVPPELKVVVCDEGRVFHVPGCKYLHQRDNESPRTMTAQEALRQGYTPCVRCLRQYLSAQMSCPRSSTPRLWAEQRTEPEPQLGPWPPPFDGSLSVPKRDLL